MMDKMRRIVVLSKEANFYKWRAFISFIIFFVVGSLPFAYEVPLDKMGASFLVIVLSMAFYMESLYWRRRYVDLVEKGK